ncbi:MAG: type II toxin-antitoxin system VapC family toxin [Paludibacteraceae bacterium]|nr:type II toxin-antitoxin system VapC family toxin [Paludibacteraceae bacterium]
MDKQAIKVYIDSNVLVHYCTGEESVVQSLTYLFQRRRKEVLFTSSLSIAQTIALLQSNRPNRKAYTKEKVSSLMDKKLTIIDLTKEDISKAFSINNKDIEDNIQYVLSQKKKCDAIVTDNTKDFLFFKGVEIMKPNKTILSRRIK